MRRLDVTATGDIAPLGPSSLALHVCDLRRNNGPFESSFTLTGAEGSVSGLVSELGVVAGVPPQAATFHVDLTSGPAGRVRHTR